MDLIALLNSAYRTSCTDQQQRDSQRITEIFNQLDISKKKEALLKSAAQGSSELILGNLYRNEDCDYLRNHMPSEIQVKDRYDWNYKIGCEVKWTYRYGNW